MPRIDLILLGYFVFNVDSEQLSRAADILLRANVSSILKADGRFIVSYRDRKRAESALCGKIEYRISKPRGVRGFFINNKNKIGAAIGALLTACMIFLSSDVVWDVRIEGDGEGLEEDILRELEFSGLSVGSRWSKTDTSEVEIRLLSSSETVSWVNINRRGAVAYVTVGRKTENNEEEKPDGYANIVASRDCVIEEIIVESGYAMVKKGESVRAGQILISGVYPSEIGGGFCYAQGEVIGRYSETVSVSSSRKKEEKKYYANELLSVEVKFFNKNINIFKKYRQPQNNCDIIKETEQVITKEKLPIAFIKTYLAHYSVFERSLSDLEMIEEASALLQEELLRYLSDKTAKRMKTSGEFSGEKYVMKCYLTVSSDITEIQKFDVNLE